MDTGNNNDSIEAPQVVEAWRTVLRNSLRLLSGRHDTQGTAAATSSRDPTGAGLSSVAAAWNEETTQLEKGRGVDRENTIPYFCGPNPIFLCFFFHNLDENIYRFSDGVNFSRPS